MLATPATTASKSLRSLARPCVIEGLEHGAQTADIEVRYSDLLSVIESISRAAMTRTDSETCTRHKPGLEADCEQYGHGIATEQ